MKLTVAVWNMAWWQYKSKNERAWSFLYDNLKADVALLTEMGAPQNCPFPHVKWQQIGLSSYYRWGSGIVSRYPLQNCYVPSCVGAVMTAKLCLGKKTPISLISMYGLHDKVANSYVANLHRYLSDLTQIFNERSCKVIIGGDFNASLHLEGKQNNTANANRLFFERLEDFGLADCMKPFAEYPVQTHCHNSDVTFPWQLDYLYASHRVAGCVKEAHVVDTADIREMSDHNPLVFTFDLV